MNDRLRYELAEGARDQYQRERNDYEDRPKSARDGAVVQAIYDGIRDVFPVDLLQSMGGEKRARQYMSLWANAAANRLLAAGLLVEPADHAAAEAIRRAVEVNQRLADPAQE
jgi:hypothetical protein